MSDITDQDRRAARQWADEMSGHPILNENARAAVRYVLANVDAPEPTLAEELREQASWAEGMGGPVHGAKFRDLATRAVQMEHDLTEARAELGRLTAEREVIDTITDHYDHYAVQKGAESNAESSNPADVKPGEPWLIKVDGRTAVGVRDGVGPTPEWSIIDTDYGGGSRDFDYAVTLVSRLVPAPRVITDHDELDRLAEGTIVRDKDGDAWRRTCDEWTTTADYGRFTSWAVSRSGPVTVLWGAGSMTHHNHQAPPPCGASLMKEDL